MGKINRFFNLLEKINLLTINVFCSKDFCKFIVIFHSQMAVSFLCFAQIDKIDRKGQCIIN